MYPQGFYDDFPKDGVTVVFGPDLKQRIKDAIGNDCQSNPTSCRERLIPIIQNTDVNTHTKRFVMVTAFVVGEVVMALSYLLAAGAGAAWLVTDVPAVRLSYSDLAQLHDIGHTDSVVIDQGEGTTPTTGTVPTMSEAPTSTGKDLITMETLTADSSEAKKGDIVYHIPADTASRLQDFLAMLGVQSLMESCKGHDLFKLGQSSRVRRAKRANTIEACLRDLGNLAADYIEGAPQNALQLAQQNFPNLPGAGQVVNFPAQNAMVDGVQVVVRTYHIVLRHREVAPAPGGALQPFNVPIYVTVSIGLTILVWAVMHAGEVAQYVVLPQGAVVADLKEDDLSCPKDIRCFDDACGAQGDNENIAQRNAFCKKVRCSNHSIHPRS
jgi:hypothetical protein